MFINSIIRLRYLILYTMLSICVVMVGVCSRGD